MICYLVLRKKLTNNNRKTTRQGAEMTGTESFNPSHITANDRMLAREFGGIFALDMADKGSLATRDELGRFASQDILNDHLYFEDRGDFDQIWDDSSERVIALFAEMNDNGILDLTPDMIYDATLDPEMTAILQQELSIAQETPDEEFSNEAEALLKAAAKAQKKANRKAADARARATGGLTRSQRRRRNRQRRKQATANTN